MKCTAFVVSIIKFVQQAHSFCIKRREMFRPISNSSCDWTVKHNTKQNVHKSPFILWTFRYFNADRNLWNEHQSTVRKQCANKFSWKKVITTEFSVQSFFTTIKPTRIKNKRELYANYTYKISPTILCLTNNNFILSRYIEPNRQKRIYTVVPRSPGSGSRIFQMRTDDSRLS